jgi:hypothetical protein
MRVARSLFSALLLSVLVSACAEGIAGRTTPSDPSSNTLGQVSSAEPARAPALVNPPLAGVSHDEGSWSNIWTAQAALAGRPAAR